MGVLSVSNLVAIYSILVGFAMIGMWGFLLSTDQVPELGEGSRGIYFTLTAEFLTAVLLIISGAGLWLGSQWARTLSPISLGMLLYTVIASAGYDADRNNLPMVAMFIVLTVLTVAAISALFKLT